jgi:hypothetical protein
VTQTIFLARPASAALPGDPAGPDAAHHRCDTAQCRHTSAVYPPVRNSIRSQLSIKYSNYNSKLGRLFFRLFGPDLWRSMSQVFTLDVSKVPSDAGGGVPCSSRTQAVTVCSGCGG